MDLREYSGQSDSEKHPWEHARFLFFSAVFHKFVKIKKPLHILDVGSGDAWFSNKLAPSLYTGSQIDCLDIHYTDENIKSISQYLSPQIRLIQQLDNKKIYDVILLLDVLEHIEEERQYLKYLLQNHANKDTVIIISVPMWQWLFSEHDTRLGHFRRYSPQLAQQMLRECQLRPLQKGSLFASLFVFRILEKLKSLIAKNSQQQDLDGLQIKSFKGQFIFAALKIDAVVSRCLSAFKVDFLGLSWWSVCRIK